jgi:phosphotransferase system  glucose/maltose/N-acetylglucosamine-specific IIC component
MEILIALIAGMVAGGIIVGLQMWLADRRSKQRKREMMKDFAEPHYD